MAVIASGGTDIGRADGGVRVTLRRAGDPQPYETACAAASIQLRFDPNGLVTLCCKSLQPLGQIGRDRLPDIWQGALRHEIEAALGRGDFSVGCQRCGSEIAQEGRAVSYAAIHDAWAGHLTEDPATRAWPVRMEFNLSNSCNLQCIQCDGDSSSSIRLHRERRAPLPKVYGDEFFEDLRAFLPKLDRIVFAGGEPFLGAENFRVWDLIASEAPHIDCMVVTNATQWTPRIEALLEKIRFSFVFSLDGISKQTYEAIRVGADLEAVMANVDRFCTYAARVGTTVAVNHCLMPQNLHEFGALLLWAEGRDLAVNVSVVRTPAHASISSLPAAGIVAAYETLLAQDDEVRPRLRRNLTTWEGELERLRRWADASSTGHPSSHTVLFFRCEGSGHHDGTEARNELEAWAHDGAANIVAIGPDDLIRRCSGPFFDDPDALVGSTHHDLTAAVTARYGNMDRYEVIATSDDRVDAVATFGTTPARIATVAVRDTAGWADEAHIMIAFGPSA